MFSRYVKWTRTSCYVKVDYFECNAMVGMTLIRPLNKGQGHSFWYQSIFYMRLSILPIQLFALYRHDITSSRPVMKAYLVFSPLAASQAMGPFALVNGLDLISFACLHQCLFSWEQISSSMSDSWRRTVRRAMIHQSQLCWDALFHSIDAVWQMSLDTAEF